MAKFTIRIEAPATWVVEVEAEDEEEADIAVRELLGDAINNKKPMAWEIDFGASEWSMDEGVDA